jgi:hypothetical protein
MADRVDAAVEPVESARAATLQHRIGAEAGFAQLATRDGSVLTGGHTGHFAVWGAFFGINPMKVPRGAFWVHITHKAPRGAD